MKQIQKAVLATDFSDTSAQAKETALWLRDKLDFHLDVIHVYDPKVMQMPAPY